MRALTDEGCEGPRSEAFIWPCSCCWLFVWRVFMEIKTSAWGQNSRVYHTPHNIHDLIVIVEGPTVNNMLFCVDWLKLMEALFWEAQSSSSLTFCWGLPHPVSPSQECQPHQAVSQVRTVWVTLTPRFTSPPQTTIHLVKCILDVIPSLPFFLPPFGSRSPCFMPGFLQKVFVLFCFGGGASLEALPLTLPTLCHQIYP